MKRTIKNPPKLSSQSRLEELLLETETELESLQAQIDKLEKQLEKLKDLKLAKQKLITLKLSIKSILLNFSESSSEPSTTNIDESKLSSLFSPGLPGELQTTSNRHQNRPTFDGPEGIFLPEQAFAEVNQVLRKRTSLNYELFRAIVFNGGRASTEQIRQYLIDHDIHQPASGKSFQAVELTDISSRVNYLVRKGLVQPDGRGNFVSRIGWTTG